MKLLKYVAIALVVLIVLAIAVPIAIINFMDPNDLKGWVVNRVRAQTGRELSIPGNIELDFFPDFRVRTGAMSLSNAAGFGDEPMFEVGEFEFAIAVMPLFSGRYEMDTIRLHGLRLRLTRNASRSDNWTGLVQPSDEPAEFNPGDFVFGGVDIQDAQIVWEDAAADEPQRVEISDLSVTTGTLMLGTPLDLQVRMTLSATQPAIEGDIALTGTINYDMQAQRSTIAPLTLDTEWRNTSLPGGRAAINMEATIASDLDSGATTIDIASLQGLGIDMRAHLETAGSDTGASGDISLTAADLALLLAVAELPAAQQVRNLPDRSLALTTRFESNARTGDVMVPEFNLQLLGGEISGEVTARNAGGSDAAVSGSVTAAGPDLPAILAVVGQLQSGPEKPLLAAAQSLAAAGDGSFEASARFEADLGAGFVDVSELTARGVGYTIDGRLNAADINSPGGPIEGNLSVRGDPAGPLLAAFGNQGIGETVRTLSVEAAISGSTSNVNLSPLSAEIGVAGSGGAVEQLRIAADSANANLDRETFALNGFSIQGLGMDVEASLNAADYASDPEVSGNLRIAPFSPRELLARFGQPEPQIMDPQALTRFALSTDFTGSATRTSFPNVSMTLDDTTLTGNLAFGYTAAAPLEFTLDVDRIDFDRYRSTAESAAPAEEGEAQGDGSLPVEMLRELSINGRLDVGELRIAGALMQEVTLTLTAEDGRVALAPVAASLYQGSYEGAIRIDVSAETPLLQFDSLLQGVEVGPLLLDVMQREEPLLTGTSNFEATFTGAGNTGEEVRRSLNGSAQFAITDGAYHGIDIAAILAQVEFMIRARRFGTVTREGTTPFVELTGSVNMVDGVARNEDLSMYGAGFRVAGSGLLADFNTEAVDYRLQVSTEVTRAADAEAEYDLGGFTLPIRCRGSIDRPLCLPELDQIAQAVLESTVRDALPEPARNLLEGLQEGGEGIGGALRGLLGGDRDR